MNLAAAVTMKKQMVPVNQVPNTTRLELRKASDGSVVSTQTVFMVPAGPVAFSGVADGSYRVAAVRVNSETNQTVGSEAVSEPFDVVNVHEIDVPNTVTVTLG